MYLWEKLLVLYVRASLPTYTGKNLTQILHALQLKIIWVSGNSTAPVLNAVYEFLPSYFKHIQLRLTQEHHMVVISHHCSKFILYIHVLIISDEEFLMFLKTSETFSTCLHIKLRM